MIEITMRFKGSSTERSCTYIKGDETRFIVTEGATGAQALDLIIGRLSRARMGGNPWRVVGTQNLSGIVPSWPYRPREAKDTTPALPGVFA